MKLGERLIQGFRYTNKSLWIILVPIILDVISLLGYDSIYKTEYIPIKQIFKFKLGLVSIPPSVKYLLEDFPSPIFQYNVNGFQGIIDSFTPLNCMLAITIVLIMSFIKGGYLSVINKCNGKFVGIRDFFILGNKVWFKFFIVDVILSILLALVLIDKRFILLYFVIVIFVYIDYSIVVDDGSILYHFKKSASIFFENLGFTIKVVLYFGLIYLPVSIVIYAFTNLGTFGVIIDIILMAYLGMVANKVVLEVYKDISRPKIDTLV